MIPLKRFCKKLRLLLLMACAWLGTSGGSVTQSVDDHLIPLQGRFDKAYDALIERRLLITPGNFGRIIEIPSPASEGEVSVAIYSKKDDPRRAFITATRARRNLWYAEFGEDPDFPKQPPVEVTRCDAEFPTAAAGAVSNALKRMLARTRPLENPERRIVLDATDIEVLVDEPPRDHARGLLTAYADGEAAEALRRLTRLLKEYCDEKEENRSGLVGRIVAETKKLR